MWNICLSRSYSIKNSVSGSLFKNHKKKIHFAAQRKLLIPRKLRTKNIPNISEVALQLIHSHPKKHNYVRKYSGKKQNCKINNKTKKTCNKGKCKGGKKGGRKKNREGNTGSERQTKHRNT
jgi:hypothetical protein